MKPATYSRAILVAGVCGALWLAVPAWPCSCVCVAGAPRSEREAAVQVRQAYDTSQIVFLGRVTQVEADQSQADIPSEYADKVATIEVIREWKGPGRPSYQLTTACCGASCGYPFEVGQFQLFFLDQDRERVSSCCPDRSNAEVRRSVRILDKVTRRKRLALPPGLAK